MPFFNKLVFIHFYKISDIFVTVSANRYHCSA